VYCTMEGMTPQASHAVEHLSDCLAILLLSLKGATVDSLGELAQLSRSGHIVATLSVDLSDVGVGSGFVHATIISTGSDALGAMVDTLPTGRAADQFVLLKDVTVVYTFNAESRSASNLLYEVIFIICFPDCCHRLINKPLLFIIGQIIVKSVTITNVVGEIKLNVSDLVHHCCYLASGMRSINVSSSYNSTISSVMSSHVHFSYSRINKS